MILGILGLDFGTSTTVFSSPFSVLPIGQDILIPSLALYEAERDTWKFGLDALEAVRPGAIITNLKAAITQNRTELESIDRQQSFDADMVITKFLLHLAQRLQNEEQLESLHVRMSCPAFWDKHQRQRLLRCATQAGFTIVGNVLLDEPVAAAVGWLEKAVVASSKSSYFGKTVMVFDMGGGTLDLALVSISRKAGTEQEVLYQIHSSCSSNLAGNAIDDVIARKIYEQVTLGHQTSSGIDRSGGVNYFLSWAREIKEALSVNQQVSWNIPLPDGKSISFEFNRDDLKATLFEVFESNVDGEPVSQAIVRALRLGAASRFGSDGTLGDLMKVSLSELAREVDAVLMVGGMARMPLLQNFVQDQFANLLDSKSVELLPDDKSTVQEVVALGLGQSAGFSNLNMMRPDFDIILKLYDAREEIGLGSQVIWDAYTMPFSLNLDTNRLAGFLEVTREITFPAPAGYSRESVAADVIVVSHDGKPLKVKGSNLDYRIRFHLTENGGGRIQMNSSGTFRITDDGSSTTEGKLQVFPEPFILATDRNYVADGDLGRYED
jgi:molecular chaperone DnaK (HSP70)